MDRPSDLQWLKRLADDILTDDAPGVPESERFEHVLAQLVIELSDERDHIDELLQLLEQNNVQEQLREHVDLRLTNKK